ncbi:MAG: hypothetical protein KatS3mg068_1677 [Candidatus Sericytochromatia bacterium]|nr:MAG: hypothetical protein KatS3mg068_1677 [Candidatus Sericytochromatia bacterium]
MKKIATLFQLKVLRLRRKIEGVFLTLKRFYNLKTTLYFSVEGYINHVLLVLLSYQVKKIFLANF